ncbi:MAG: 16S rRNA (cytidine(1402)-2'-O)-methyltransferase [Eubacteriales bacterium]|nr:16S rRNA (cytidine(1402)-2'-O)-methyltransferase [Eubacteriales bacterium]
MKEGTLYLVPLAIGNPLDISPRAIECLSNVEIILCEDTRTFALNMAKFSLSANLLSYHAHNEAERNPEVLDLLAAGHDLALVSDAGMPVISDPGQSLVRACREARLRVSALPGPNAALTALVASGLDASRFVFEGFIGKRDAELRRRLLELLSEERSMIFYEAPHRLARFYNIAEEVGLGDRLLLAARELTKQYEEYSFLTLKEHLELLEIKEPRGEYVLVLEGLAEYRKRCPEAVRASEANELLERMQAGLESGKPLKEIAKELSQQFNYSKREIYQKLLDISK